jgi:hypothetical protein
MNLTFDHMGGKSPEIRSLGLHQLIAILNTRRTAGLLARAAAIASPSVRDASHGMMTRRHATSHT